VDPASVAVVVAAYLLGSVDLGVIVPRLSGIDIYHVGSGNPGATNVLRQMGRRAAALVLLGDALKGFLAALAGDLVGGEALGFLAGFAAVVGHCFPVWHRFRGGRGVATGAGVALWMVPLLAVALLAAWAVVVLLARKASLASLVAVAAYVPGLVVFGVRGWALGWAIAVGVLIVARHVPNIRRLVAGEEQPLQEPAA
jgi:glycerol-3-phosphate acyltransferase PlsY